MNEGIEIEKDAFNTLVNNYIDKIKAGNTEFSNDDYIKLIRIWNTISKKNLLNESKLYHDFYNLFFPDFFKIAVKTLKGTLTKGMAFYSREYDIWFGGKLNDNSYFSIK